VGAIDLAHTARADQCEDLVRAEASAGREAHVSRLILRRGRAQEPQGSLGDLMRLERARSDVSTRLVTSSTGCGESVPDYQPRRDALEAVLDGRPALLTDSRRTA
jgi:hypothetical protein